MSPITKAKNEKKSANPTGQHDVLQKTFTNATRSRSLRRFNDTVEATVETKRNEMRIYRVSNNWSTYKRCEKDELIFALISLQMKFIHIGLDFRSHQIKTKIKQIETKCSN